MLPSICPNIPIPGHPVLSFPLSSSDGFEFFSQDTLIYIRASALSFIFYLSYVLEKFLKLHLPVPWLPDLTLYAAQSKQFTSGLMNSPRSLGDWSVTSVLYVSPELSKPIPLMGMLELLFLFPHSALNAKPGPRPYQYQIRVQLSLPFQPQHQR